MRIGQRLWVITTSIILLFILFYWVTNVEGVWIDDFMLVFSIISVCAIHFLIDRFFIKRIREIMHFASKLSEGDLLFKLKIDKNDEVGLLAKSINNLRQYVVNATSFIKDIEEGNLNAEYNLSGQVNDQLSSALLSMRNRMKEISEQEKERTWVTNGLTKFNDLLRTHNDNISVLSKKIISDLVKYLEVNQGGLFLVENLGDQVQLELKASYAYNREKFLEKTVEVGEGLVGQAYLEKSIIHLSDVPKNYINITSGLGQAVPRVILVVPIIINNEVYGVLELASFKEIPEYKVDFLKRFCESMGSTVSNVRNVERTRKLLEEAQFQGEQMRAQEEEMRQNVEELAATQEEMARKQTELEKINRKMKGHENVLKKALEKAKEKEKEAKKSLELLQSNEELMLQNMQEMERNQMEMQEKQEELDSVNAKLKSGEEILKKSLEDSRKREVEFQLKNEQLLAQEEEMRQNMEELSATQEIMSKKQKELEVMQEKMKMNEKILQKAFTKSKEGEKKLKLKNEQLLAQEEEMRQNVEELSATQEEMSKKQAELEKVNNRVQRNEKILRKSIEKSRANEVELKEKNKQLLAQEEELKQNMEVLKLTQQELSLQMEEVQSKNQTIVESINYAKTIQESILPTARQRREIFYNNFVFFKPKDIVSGDFYWLYKHGDYRIVTVVDCTGHGVPGAFISIVAHAALYELVNLKGMRDPAEILHGLNIRIIERLNQTETSDEKELSNDGVDLSICVFENTVDNKVKLTFSGAKCNAYVIKNQELIELKGDRKSVGGEHNHLTKSFSNQEIILSKGDIVYQSTDGIIDQANGDRKRFSSKKLKTLFENIHTKTMSEQKKELSKALNEHQQLVNQRDDITVIGVKI